MTIAYLIGTEGPSKGRVIELVDLTEWIFGRDPSLSYYTIEDSMVSRRHMVIRHEDDAYFLENFSSTNPVKVDGTEIDRLYQLKEGDEIEIGASKLRFTFEKPAPVPAEEEKVSTEFTIEEPLPYRFAVKVISGPNQGAEFGLEAGKSYLIGKDPFGCDIVFQDMSVSRKHAKMELDEDGLQIEDLESKNGTFVNGEKIDAPTLLGSQDLVAVGTTSFLVIDHEESRETLYSPKETLLHPYPAEEVIAVPGDALALLQEKEKKPRNWKELLIPTRHLIVASIFALFVFFGVVSLLSLFRSEEVVAESVNSAAQIQIAVGKFPTVAFNYDKATGSLFLSGHVMTDLDMSELTYLLETVPFVSKIENTVVVDEGVWESTNALIRKNPIWKAVTIGGEGPGEFVARGYVANLADKNALQDYLDVNFPYNSHLKDEVYAEDSLRIEVTNTLYETGLASLPFEVSGGTVSLSGRISREEEKNKNSAVSTIEKIPGIRNVKDFVIVTTVSSSRVNISDKYQVTGVSKHNNKNEYVLINGRIVGEGDTLEGMLITQILDSEIYLEKDHMKYKIDYNVQ